MSSLDNLHEFPPFSSDPCLKGDPPDLNNDREPKKTKTCDVDLEDEIMRDGQNEPEKPVKEVTFKDKLMGKQKSEMVISLDDSDEIEMEERDVLVVIKDIGPSIIFSEKIRKELNANVRHTLVVRLLSGGLGYRGLDSAIKAIRRPKGHYRIIDLENNYFLVRFTHESDYAHALLDGPWIVRGTYLLVQPWTPSFSAKKVGVSAIAAWVRFPGLPFQYYHKSVIRKIGGLLGNVIRIDYNTSVGGRGKFARMAVEIDASKPIISTIEVDGHIQRVEYEGLPTVCYHCGKIGV